MSRTIPVRRVAAATLTGGVAVAVAVCLPTAAHATDTRAAQVATVRAAHLSPDMPGVDIYLTSFTGRTSVFARNAVYGQVSPYRQVTPGSYTFALRRHGAAPGTSPLESWTFAAGSGDAYTAAAVGEGGGHRGVILHDNLTPPPAGRANVRLIQASSRSGITDVVAVNGPVIARDARFGTSTGYASVKAGTWPLQATGDGRTATARVSVPAGTVTSVVLLDARTGGIRLTSVVDAAGATKDAAPKGSVDAGGGGTAPLSTRPQGSAPLLGLAALISLAGLGFVLRRRGAARR